MIVVKVVRMDVGETGVSGMGRWLTLTSNGMLLRKCTFWDLASVHEKLEDVEAVEKVDRVESGVSGKRGGGE